jgi:D-lactate dehydrogenase
MAKIAFFDAEKQEEDYFRQNLGDHELFFTGEPLDAGREYDPNIYNAEIVSIFTYSKAHKEILDKFPNLKYVTTRSTGFDHIDLEYCKSRGVSAGNVPTYGMHSVAEHTFALILSLSQKIIPSIERTRRGDFDLDGLRGFELYGKTLGIVGTGNIGKVVAEIALGMGMKVIAYNRHEDEDLKNKGVEFKDLDSVLGQSDIITLHLPYNQDTHHIINLGNINKFKKGVVFINNARGGLVETQAILEALNQGIFSAVGLDVLEEEFGIREESELITSRYLENRDLKTGILNHILLDREDVLITPHNAFDSNEAVAQILDTTAKNIKSFLEGNPQNLVGVDK